MIEQIIYGIFERLGVILTGSHIVYASGRHGSAYVDKDMLYPDTQATSELCEAIARQFTSDCIDAVVGPEKGGIILSQWTAYHLSCMTSQKVLAFYAEKDGRGGFILKRGNAKERVSGRRILCVEDILTTGSSAKKVVELVRSAGGTVVGLAALCNRGKVTSKDVANPKRFVSLLDLDLESWLEAECELCAQNVPINTVLGKGKEFLAKKATK